MRSCVAVEPDPFPAQRRTVHAAARTDRGPERPDNEDRAAFADLGNGILFEPPAAATLVTEASSFAALVCDGMGGEAGGEIASTLAIHTILPFLAAWKRSSQTDVESAAIAAIEAASDRIKERGRREPRLARMGTTTTLAIVNDRRLICAQVGDSRAYLFRAGALFQLTQDQTMAELLRSSGTLRASEVDAIVGPNVILQAVGSSPRLDVAITRTGLIEGDTILLCSDGLFNVVSDDAIAETLRSLSADPEHACDALVQKALDAGASDNVTCVVFRP